MSVFESAVDGVLDLKRNSAHGQDDLFGDFGGGEALVSTPVPVVDEWDKRVRLAFERPGRPEVHLADFADALGDDGLAQVSAAGFFSAIPMTVITAPFERVKVLLQLQGQKQLGPGEKPKYSGGTDVVRQLYKEGGIRSVYRGSVMTLARDGPGSAVYFATYETIKRRLTPKDENGKPGKLSIPAVMAAGGAAGVAMWIPVFPVDTVKSRLQSAEGNPTISGTVKQLYARGGFKAFFPGMAPAMARAVPANAATFLGVELAHQALTKMLD